MSAQPVFSVVVPTYARPERLRRCLGALVALDYPRDGYEIIVVDDGSPRPATDIVAEFAARGVRLLARSHAGPAAARNAGAREARGEWLAFTDDDCTPRADWLRALEPALAAAPEAIIAGRVVNALPANRYSTASQLLVDYLLGYFNANTAKANFATSNNLAVARAAFLAAGGFDESFRRAAGEDRELGDRWQRSGREVRSCAEAVVEHAHELSLPRFWRQHFNYGRGAWEFRRARLARGAPPQPLEPWQFYTDLIRFPYSARQPNALSLSLLLVLSQIANALGYLSARFGGNDR